MRKKIGCGCEPKGMLQGRYGLAEMNRSRLSSTAVDLGLIGAGVVIGYVAFPYKENALGSVLIGAAGSIVAVGLVLLAHHLIGKPSASAANAA